MKRRWFRKKNKEALDTSFFPLNNMDFWCGFENEFNVQIQKSIAEKSCDSNVKTFCNKNYVF